MKKRMFVKVLYFLFLMLAVSIVGCGNSKGKYQSKEYVGHYEATYKILNFNTSKGEYFTDTLDLNDDGTFVFNNNAPNRIGNIRDTRSDSGKWWIEGSKIVFQGKDYLKQKCSLDNNWDEILSDVGKERYKNKNLLFQFGSPVDDRMWVKID